ncbi:hypothetical protein ACJJTC_018344 [Scirpophaga incertulas]
MNNFSQVPTFAYEKRLSRIETLRLAITYISFMCELLHGSPPPHHTSHHALHPPRHVFDAEVIFITVIAAVIAADKDPRAKRDLSLLTKLLSAKGQQQHKTKIYHVQSVDNYIVKAVPKVHTAVQPVETVTQK